MKHVYAKKKKKNLVSNFSDFKGIISVTSDCLTGSNNMGYICVTSHFINEN